jgi:hypothetical protein
MAKTKLRFIKKEKLGIEETNTLLGIEIIPADVLRTIFPIISGIAKHRDQRFNIQSWLTLTRSSWMYDEPNKQISYPTMWGLVPSGSEDSGDYSIANKWFPNVPNIREPSIEATYIQAAKKDINNITEQSDRVSMQFDTFRRAYRSNPFISKIAVQGKKINIHMNLNAIVEVMHPLERYFDLYYRSVATPKGMSYMPMGLKFGKHRPTMTSYIPGYVGVWNTSSQPQFTTSKDMQWALLYTFAAYCLWTGQRREDESNEKLSYLYEQILMEFAFTVDEFMANGLDSGSWEEYRATWPIFNRRKAHPNLSSFLITRPAKGATSIVIEDWKRGTLGDWLYAGYMFSRGLRMLKEMKFEGFNRSLEWKYSGTAIPTRITVEDCFHVSHRLNTPDSAKLESTAPYKIVATGLKQIFYTPRDSSVLIGTIPTEICFMLRDSTKAKANVWHTLRYKEPVNFLSEPCDVDIANPIVPDIGKTTADYYNVNLCSAMDLGRSASILRTDLEDEEDVISMELDDSSAPCLIYDIPRSLLAGGLPFFSIDTYLPESPYISNKQLSLDETEIGQTPAEDAMRITTPPPLEKGVKAPPGIKVIPIPEGGDESEAAAIADWNDYVEYKDGVADEADEHYDANEEQLNGDDDEDE